MKKLYRYNQMRSSIVVFMDILGFSNLSLQACQSGIGNKLLKNLNNAIKEAKSSFNFVYLPPYDCSICEIKLFTDNIVIGFPIPEGKSIYDVMHNAIIHIAAYQCSLLNAGFFVRGGISIGDHYMDNNIVFGPALIESYLLESEKADKPRVVFSQDALKYVNVKDPMVAEDNIEKLLFINYLEMTKYYSSGPIARLEKHRDYIHQNLLVNSNTPKVLPKYIWTRDYHNNYCGKMYPNEIQLLLP